MNLSTGLHGGDYNEFNEYQKYELMRLVNLSESLSLRIGQKITEEDESSIVPQVQKNIEYQAIANESAFVKLDKYDYMIAGFCGAAAGLMDAFLVKNPEFSFLGKQADKLHDSVVIKTSQVFWQFDTRQKGKPTNRLETLVQCISYLEQAWKDCLPTKNHPDLRMMLLIGNGALCAVDGVDAAIRGKGHIVVTICHLNLIGWERLVTLAFTELKIRYGPVVVEALSNYVDAAGGLLPLTDQREIEKLSVRLAVLEKNLQEEYAVYVTQIEMEYEKWYAVLDAATDVYSTPIDSLIDFFAAKSVELKKIVFFELYGMIMADGKIESKEKELIELVENAFGLSENNIRILLRWRMI